MEFLLNVDPVAFTIGSIEVKWYGIAYAVGVILGGMYAKFLVRRCYSDRISESQIMDFMNWIIVAIIVGGRLGYVLFYNFSESIKNPIDIFLINKGGMSFHGAVIGIIFIAFYLFSKVHKVQFYVLADITAASSSFGIFLGRIANFINGELYGKVTNSSLGVVFRGQHVERYPTQLFEAFLEGVVLFLIMFYATFKLKFYEKKLCISAIFLIFYAIFRIFIEFFREPDMQIGYIMKYFTMGQLLSIPMIILGIYFLRKFLFSNA